MDVMKTRPRRDSLRRRDGDVMKNWIGMDSYGVCDAGLGGSLSMDVKRLKLILVVIYP